MTVVGGKYVHLRSVDDGKSRITHIVFNILFSCVDHIHRSLLLLTIKKKLVGFVHG